jgi:hypothetical protein
VSTFCLRLTAHAGNERSKSRRTPLTVAIVMSPRAFRGILSLLAVLLCAQSQSPDDALNHFVEPPGAYPSPLEDPPSAGGCGNRAWQLQWATRQRAQAALMTEASERLNHDPTQTLSTEDCHRFASNTRSTT